MGGGWDTYDGADIFEAPEQEAQTRLDALNGLDAMADQARESEWVDQGMRDVPVADLPNPTDIHNASDWRKLSQAEMRAGLARFQEMRPTIENGAGANSDYWADRDTELGLDYEHGYQRVYDAFYHDSDKIRLTKDGDDYDVINGQHRIWLAKELGIDTLPANVVERRRR